MALQRQAAAFLERQEAALKAAELLARREAAQARVHRTGLNSFMTFLGSHRNKLFDFAFFLYVYFAIFCCIYLFYDFSMFVLLCFVDIPSHCRVTVKPETFDPSQADAREAKRKAEEEAIQWNSWQVGSEKMELGELSLWGS